MTTVDIHEAAQHLEPLVDRINLGEETLIAVHGRPVARLTPVDPPVGEATMPPRVFGRMRGKIRIAEDFDAPMAIVPETGE